MNNLSQALKKFASNRTTLAIMGVVLCLIILYIGYKARINEKTKLTKIPYAVVTIQPRQQITSDMIGQMEVPEAFLKGRYYVSEEALIGKYSNYNTVISEGSLFYEPLVISQDELPDSSFVDVPEGYTVVNLGVNMSNTYANSMYPGNYVDIYLKGVDDEKIMYGKFIYGIKILDVKDSEGRHVFENTDESRTPAYMLFAIPEDIHLLLRKSLYLKDYSVELQLVPNTDNLKEGTGVYVVSDDIKNFVLDNTKTVDVLDLPELNDLNDKEESNVTVQEKAE